MNTYIVAYPKSFIEFSSIQAARKGAPRTATKELMIYEINPINTVSSPILEPIKGD